MVALAGIQISKNDSLKFNQIVQNDQKPNQRESLKNLFALHFTIFF